MRRMTTVPRGHRRCRFRRHPAEGVPLSLLRRGDDRRRDLPARCSARIPASRCGAGHQDRQLMRPPQRPPARTDARSDRRSAPGDAATRPNQPQLPRDTPDQPPADRRSPLKPHPSHPAGPRAAVKRATAFPTAAARRHIPIDPPPTSTGAAPAASSPEAYRTPAARPSPPSVSGRHPITLNNAPDDRTVSARRAGDAAAADATPPKAYRCPCCGGVMIVVETFRRGGGPAYRPAAAVPVVRIDSS